MKVEDNKLKTDGYEFTLPSVSNYPEGHRLVIPVGNEFVHIVANGEWKIEKTIPVLTHPLETIG